MFSRIAIIGPGLLGGSIAGALRARMPDTSIHVWARRPEAIARVREKNLADLASTDIRECVEGADLVIFSVVIGAMEELAGRIAEVVAPETLITDVGSVKASVVESLSRIFCKRGMFIGSHPMAGSEQTGLEAARPDLFEGSACIVTPEARTPESAVAGAKRFWESIGCRVGIFSPQEHDEMMALISHLPHLLAATLVNLVCASNPESLNFCGNGFRDATRIAAGAPGMWIEIFESNRRPLRKSLEAMIEKLREAVKLLDEENPEGMKKFLMEAKQERDRLGRRQ